MTDAGGQGDLLAGLKLPRTTARILKFAHEIQDTRPERPDYLHSVLCQVGLPRSETKSLTFERTNGSASLLIEAGKLWNGSTWVQQPLPCGTRPRLALVHVSSEAVRSQSPVVEIGGSVREFLIRLGVDTGGREYATFAKQMRALSACRMSLGFGSETIDAKPIERFNAWTDNEGRRELHSPGVIELNSEVLCVIDRVRGSARRTRPVRFEAQCPCARCIYLAGAQAPQGKELTGERVTWKNLRDQFGQEYSDPKNFKRKMVSTLRSVLAVYPDARIEQVVGGAEFFSRHSRRFRRSCTR